MSFRKFLSHYLKFGGRPANDDLTGVLRHVALGRLEPSRRRIANDEDTRAMLEGGLDVLHEDLLEHTGADFSTGTSSTLFASVSMRRVVSRALERAESVKGVRPTEGKFKDRWKHHARFAEDLISYLFRLAPQRRRLEAVDAFVDSLRPNVTLHELIRQLADVELFGTIEDRNTGLQIVVQGATPNHERVRAHVTAIYREILPAWARIYEKIGARYGLRLKPGYTWLDVAIMLDAVLEGVALRARCQARPARSSAGEPVISATILALLPGLLENYDGTDREQVGQLAAGAAIPMQRPSSSPRRRAARRAVPRASES